MDNSALQRIKDIISQSDKIAIAVGMNPSIDEMAAALSLSLALAAGNKNATVVAPQDPIVELSNLVGIDRVKTGFEGSSGDLVVSFPYREGEIEKVSYTIEDNLLNIVVKAGEQGLSFDEHDVKYTRGADTPQLLIVVGTSNMTDIEGIFDPEMLKDTTIINIDNKETNERFGDLVLVSPRFSSVSEQMADLLMALGFDPDIDVAQNLLSGISYATSNFQDPTTSYLAFEMAALLMKKGAVRNTSAVSTRPVAAVTPREERVQQPRADRFPQQNNRPQQPRPQPPVQAQPQPEPQQPLSPLDKTREELRRQAQLRQQQDTPARDAQQPAQQPRPQQNQNQPRQQQNQPREQRNDQRNDQRTNNNQNNQPKAPADWLTPKVYKGSSNV